MADKTKIEWTDATWNPVTGCTKISPGCKHCYAERIAERFRGTGGYFDAGFNLTLRPGKLDEPIKWRRSRMIFVNSMSDLFHEDIPDSYIEQVFETMEQADQHIYQVLTKRPERMAKFLAGYKWRRPYMGEADLPRNGQHIWFGVSVENDDYSHRVEVLQGIPDIYGALFVSFEPLLGPVPETLAKMHRIDWVIAGGESGPGARPMNPEWVREIRDWCLNFEEVAPTWTMPGFFFKQWGAYGPDGKRGGKAANGRILDGETHTDFPVQINWWNDPINPADRGRD